MRDRQRVEALSLAAAIGLWANDVVLALYHATTDEEVDAQDANLLSGAADRLQEATSRADKPLQTPLPTSGLATSEAVLNAATILAAHNRVGIGDVLIPAADTLRQAATGSLRSLTTPQYDAVTLLFATVAEFQLIESNSVLSHHKDQRQWMETHTISSF